ncbi:MAG: (d)CMP kinase [Candidatus Palauibacterales bacterium]|nr:(d)CMP kinase [Candidatus Palauibacterales bacterium]
MSPGPAGGGGPDGDHGRHGIRVAIDGPAASGKSTTARAVAERLGYAHLNSGLLYRAITWAGLEGGWVDAGPDEFARRVGELDLELRRRNGEFVVVVADRRPGGELTTRAVSRRVSDVAAREPARTRALEELREAGRRGGVVCDGRDIGTVVFPDAELKVYLVATAEERARRRLLDYDETPTEERIAAEAERLRARDEKDAGRELAPLRKPDDAVEIDTTDLRPGEVVDSIVELARERGA